VTKRYNRIVVSTTRLWYPSSVPHFDEMSRPERSLLLDLYAAHHKAGQLVEVAAAAAGTTADDYAFLSIVAGREPVTPTDISREFGLSLSTVLFRANGNVQRGHLRRVANPEDGRSFLLRLTPAGRETWRRAGNELRRSMRSLQAHLDVPADELQRALRALQDAVDVELDRRRARAAL
jgi:DNA-binding MarR family transcriptional regulator